MRSSIYPIMPALPMSMAKGLKKSPVLNSVVQKVAANRGNGGISLAPYPVWSFEFDLDRVQGNEALASSVIAQFMGTLIACGGRAGLFLFTDPQDYTATNGAGAGMVGFTTNGPITVGDGVTTQFQLARLIGGAGWDLIQNINGSPNIYVNGGAPGSNSISSTGVVSFLSPPAAGATLSWTGSFYYLCRFDADTVDATRVFSTNSGTDQWDVESIKFQSEFV